MKVCIMSKRESELNGGESWRRQGENVRYFRSELERSAWRKPGPIRMLSCTNSIVDFEEKEGE